MFFTNTVVLTTLSKHVPASSSNAFIFSKALSVAFFTSPPTSSPVAGSSGIWPDVNSKFPTLTACE